MAPRGQASSTLFTCFRTWNTLQHKHKQSITWLQYIISYFVIKHHRNLWLILI